MTMSFGPLVGSMATEIVCARSCAEMPVEMPSFASIETVNAVWFGVPLTCVIIGILSCSARSCVSARQMSPRPYLRHEVHGMRACTSARG